MYDPNDMPSNLEEWEQMLAHYINLDQQRYAAETAQARADAETRWQAELPARRAAMMEQARAAFEAKMAEAKAAEALAVDDQLSDERMQELALQVVEEIEAQLAREKQAYIAQAESMVAPPKDRRHFETMYACFKEEIDRAMRQAAEPEPAPAIDTYNAIWTDGERYWDVANACFINPNGRMPIDQSHVVMLGSHGVSSFEENIRQNIRLYSQTDPRIQLGPEVMDTEELFTRLRTERDRRITATDYLLTPDYPISQEKREAVTAYRTALRDLPVQEGAPWDGGGAATPWPELK